MSQALQNFLGVRSSSSQSRLVLPHFHGIAKTGWEGPEPPLAYRGPLFAERDTRAAFYVRTLLERAVEPHRIAIEAATAGQPGSQGPTFLFGSRSNVAVLEWLRRQPRPLVSFEFGTEWTIRCAGKTFSMADPSTADPASYEAATDYGVVARLENGVQGSVFLIAGLGGRATEACGYYLLNNWWRLAERFDDRPFASVLEFPAPFDRDQMIEVAEVVQAGPASQRPF